VARDSALARAGEGVRVSARDAHKEGTTPSPIPTTFTTIEMTDAIYDGDKKSAFVV